ncbi:RIP metalloprotease RseP [Aerococcus sp. HMSC10H05]|uniref:RIP metalloprotease RseP n=1 Tax=Aerococcus sp. HMSC10H05 TaxID=1581084 RepID=UPI0008A304AE|nr:RIP metalloprotease RseP [Aerococcus sp. HMSC10H05]OFU48452.1 metalloprotease RseP [Aerococcus sp. HMSC10H05]
MTTIIAFIFIFSVIVIVHEFGHYYFAKKAGILVREFSIGMGPKIFHFEAEETTYTVRMLPIGGYVRMAGLEEMSDTLTKGMQVVVEQNEEGVVDTISLENDSQNFSGLPLEVWAVDLEKDMFIEGIPYGGEDKVRYQVSKTANIIESDGTLVKVAPIERQFQSANIWQRLIVNFAGPMNNFILGILAFIILAFMQGGVWSNTAELGVIQADSAAQVAGLEEGDQIVAIDGQDVETFDDMQAIVQTNPDQSLTFTINRDGQEQDIDVTPKVTEVTSGETVGMIGVQRVQDTSFMAKITYGFTSTWAMITGIFSIIAGMFKTGFDINNFGGPVYMYQTTSQVVSFGLAGIISWLAALSINLGIVNLLPVPALDGGKIVLNFIELVRGKPLQAKTEGIINVVGAVLVIVLMIAVTWNDIMRMFG